MIRILDGLDGSRGPGLAWTTGHLAFIAVPAMFISTFLQMRRIAGRNALSNVSATIGIVGILALSTQFVIDMVVGFLRADRAGMGVRFEEIQAVPGVSIAVYDGGPFFFYIGRLALVVRRVKVRTPFLVLLDLLLPFIDKDLIPLGAVFLLASFAPLAGQVSPTAKPVPAVV